MFLLALAQAVTTGIPLIMDQATVWAEVGISGGAGTNSRNLGRRAGRADSIPQDPPALVAYRGVGAQCCLITWNLSPAH